VPLLAGEHALERALATAPAGEAHTALAHVRAAVEAQYDRLVDDIALMIIRPTA
jgi:hypothetical protein